MRLSVCNLKSKNQKKEKKMKRIIISMIITFSLISVFSFARIVFNWPCLLYDGQCPPVNSSPSQSSVQNLSPSLGHLSIDAAGFFLQSNSDFQSFLKKVELSEIYGSDYADLIDLVTSSIDNMEIANSIYYQVWHLSKSLERNPVVLSKMTGLDYRLILDEKRMIPSIFIEVVKFLKPGNMSGAFEKIYNDTGEILLGMKSLLTLLESNSIDIPKCWEVNQLLLKSQLFGQYISQVFFEIKKSIM
jgi:hypothetical protein